MVKSTIEPVRIRIPIAVWIPRRITIPIGIWITCVIVYIIRVRRGVHFLLCISVFRGVIISGIF